MLIIIPYLFIIVKFYNNNVYIDETIETPIINLLILIYLFLIKILKIDNKINKIPINLSKI